MSANSDCNVDDVFLALGWRKLKHQRQVSTAIMQGPRSKFSSGGAKEECVKEIFFWGGGGAGGGMLVDFYSISLK